MSAITAERPKGPFSYLWLVRMLGMLDRYHASFQNLQALLSAYNLRAKKASCVTVVPSQARNDQRLHQAGDHKQMGSFLQRTKKGLSALPVLASRFPQSSANTTSQLLLRDIAKICHQQAGTRKSPDNHRHQPCWGARAPISPEKMQQASSTCCGVDNSPGS